MLPWPLSVGDKLGPEEILSPSAAAGWAETFPPRANFAEIRGWWWSSPGSSPGGCYCPTVIVAAGLAMPPTVTTTGCTPSGALGGITKLICVAPARPDGMPAKAICAGTTPTVTVTHIAGYGHGGGCGGGSNLRRHNSHRARNRQCGLRQEAERRGNEGRCPGRQRR